MRSLSELFQYAADTVFRVTRIEELVPDAEYQAVLGDKASEPWVYVEGVRLDQPGGTPIAFSRVFINRAYAAVVPDLTGFSGAIYRLIEQRFGVSVEDVEQQISAEPMGKYAARQLGSSTRVWAVRVVRRYFDAEGAIIQTSLNYHAADHFSYTMHLRREGGKGWV
jgi:DNA-binding GntR family transcriptional regulator